MVFLRYPSNVSGTIKRNARLVCLLGEQASKVKALDTFEVFYGSVSSNETLFQVYDSDEDK